MSEKKFCNESEVNELLGIDNAVEEVGFQNYKEDKDEVIANLNYEISMLKAIVRAYHKEHGDVSVSRKPSTSDHTVIIEQYQDSWVVKQATRKDPPMSSIRF